MSICKERVVDMYLNKMSIPEISKYLGTSNSLVYYYLKKAGIRLRSRKEAINLVKHKISATHKGVKRVFTEEWKRHISDGQKRRWKGRVKGCDIHNGYFRLTVGGNSGRLLHVVVMEEQLGRRLNKDEVVHHINGDRRDNRIENLKLMSRAEHSRLHAKERQEKGQCYDISLQTRCGEQNHAAKLNWEKVNYIRTSGETTKKLMERFGVSKSVINRIKSNKSWRIENVN